MNNYDHIFHTLNERDSPDNMRAKFIGALKGLAIDITRNPKEAVNIAYGIAGLMATDYARTLESSDPINEILTIAGELETNPSNADELRLELVQKIDAL